MGSLQSNPSNDTFADVLNDSGSPPRTRRAKRLMDKFRHRQLSKSDTSPQTSTAIDPITARAAQNHRDGGEILNRDNDAQSADLDQITMRLRDDEESATENNNNSDETPPQQKPVPNEDRHVTCDATHTVEAESTKQNADKAVSCNPTATDKRSRQEGFEKQLRESSDKKTFSGQFDGAECQILIETESWRTAKNWNSDSKSSEIRTSQAASSYGNVIVIREAPTSSSSESNFTDPHSPDDTDRTLELTVKKLEQLDLSNHETLIVDGGATDSDNEMPIVKKSGENCQQENGNDRGMFNVSRVKRVELSEIPLDISPSATTPEQQTVTTPTQGASPGNGSGNNVAKASNGSGRVLHQVIALTTANHGDGNHSGKSTPKTTPAFVPEKLHLSAYEKFEGQMLINWFGQSLQSIAGAMTTSLNEHDLNVLALHYCGNLLTTGVIRQLDASESMNDVFKPNSMYQWTHKEQTSIQATPGKLETGTIWPHANEKKTSPMKSREGESKIPKLLASTPKARIQLISSIVTLTDHPINQLNGNEAEKNKVKELKIKIGKCETIQEMFILIKSFLNECNMQSSESSSNSGIFTGSLLNGTDTTIFDRSIETTVFNVLNKSEPSSVVAKTPPKGRTVKSRTSPSTPTGTASRSDPKRFRRNLSVEAVNNTPAKSTENVNGTGCKRCASLLTSPKKTVDKRMVDKATVMDVEPLVLLKETNSIETQTESDIKEEKEEKKAEVSSAPIPPPPPMMMMSSNIPPPPPLPVPMASNIPGPPPPPPPNINGSSIPIPPNFPPPPMPQGSLLSPLPLPPPIALNSGPALRKKSVNPPKQMKPLYWTRIIVTPLKPPEVIDGTKSGASSPEEAKENEESEELWMEIDETKLDNLDEFTELFSRQGIVPKAKTSAPLPKVKAIKVLDSKRSQNVGIFVRSIHVDFAEIEHAIYHCDTSVISLEKLQHIMEIKASNEELLMIKEAVANHVDGLPPLDAPESFLLRISQVSSSAERISCIVFQAEFEEQCTMVSRKLMTVKMLCEFLLENDGLKEVFSIILTLGNFMNGGNRQRGQADGFGLEILGKLKDVKSKDPKITLLHFIVKTYIERCRKNGCGIADLVLPIPNPNDVDKSLSIDFEECKQQLNSLKAKVEECKKITEKVIAASAEDCVQPFKEKMESFIEMAIQKIDSRYCKLSECLVVFIKTIKFYKYTPKKGTLEETAPAQFFEYWTSFTSDFNDIYKKEIAILTNELLKKTRQVTKPQSKPTSGENNLKARINRLKNRNN